MSPVYSYECAQGHQWDEVRGLAEDSSRSAEPCQACLEAADNLGCELHECDLPDFAGKKVVAQVSVKLSGHGFTPKFFPNREQK